MNTEKHNLIEVVEFCRQQGIADKAEIVGRWVWVEFDTKPSSELRQAMKDFGFRWSKRRGRWAHNCGHYSRPGQRDPRFTYGHISLDEAEVSKVA
jgi:hypothetical protein